MRSRWLGLVALAACLSSGTSAVAGDWRFSVGPTFESGIMNVYDVFKDNVEYHGYDVSSEWTVPVGLSFCGSYEFDHGSRLSADIGPAGMIQVAEAGGGDASFTYWDVPVGATYGLVLFPKSNVSPYLRLGVRYHIVGGDFVNSSTPGFVGLVGIEFLRHKRVGFGIEAGYDSSQVSIDDLKKHEETKVRAGEVLIALRANF